MMILLRSYCAFYRLPHFIPTSTLSPLADILSQTKQHVDKFTHHRKCATSREKKVKITFIHNQKKFKSKNTQFIKAREFCIFFLLYNYLLSATVDGQVFEYLWVCMGSCKIYFIKCKDVIRVWK